MAKKKSMNLFLAVSDKMALFAAVCFAGWAVFVTVIAPPRVELKDGRKMTAEGAGRDAADRASQSVAQLSRSTNKTADQIDQEISWVPMAVEQFGKVEATVAAEPNPVPPFPPSSGEGVIEDRLYILPELMALSDVQIEASRAYAMYPDEPGTVRLTTANSSWKDVDFVSVKATVPFKQIRERFNTRFAGPQVEKELEYPEPVFAAVDLQRSKLVDGRWSDWKSAERLVVDEYYGRIASEQVGDLTIKQIEVKIQQDLLRTAQELIVQPWPYDMTVEWKPAWLKDEEEEQAQQQRQLAQRRAAPQGVGRRGRTARGAAGGPGGFPGGPGGPGFGGVYPGGAYPGAAYPGGFGAGPYGAPGVFGNPYGGPGGFGNQPGLGNAARNPVAVGRNARSRSGYSSKDDPQQLEWLKQETIDVWAHDGGVESGGIYRYRLRVGFYNPIAGYNWFSPEQQDYRYQLILWTPFIEVDTVVEVPERTLFFPFASAARRGEEPSIPVAQVEVFRWQDDQWHSHRYKVSPGTVVGTTEDSDADGGAPGDEAEQIDYTTGVTVVDIIPKCTHYYGMGRTVRSIETTDIVFKHDDGTIQRIGIDKRTWPAELSTKLSAIRRQIREQKNVAARN